MFHVFGEQPFRTDGDLLALSFAPDGSLWSVEDSGVLRQWRPVSQDMLDWHLLSEVETVWSFSGDARLLASGSDDLTIWDVPRGRLLTVLEQSSWVTTLAFAPDARLVASGHDDGRVQLWDLRGRRRVRELHAHGRPVSALAFSADGRWLATAGEDKVIRRWLVETGEPAGSLSGHTDRIPALAWHPQGHRLYSAGWDTTARVWDTATGEPVILLNSHDAQVTALALSPCGRLLACADSTSAVHVWDTTTHQTLNVLRKHTGEVRCLAFGDDGQLLASGGTDRIIRLWTGLDRPIICETASRSGAGSRPDTSNDPPASLPRKVFRSSTIDPDHPSSEARATIALSPDGVRLATIDDGARLRVWDTASVRPVCDDREAGPLFALAASADGRWIAGGGNRVIHLWEAGTGRRRDLPDGQPLPTTALAFAPDGTVLASASGLGVDVWLWNTGTGEPILLIPDAVDGCTVEALALHSEGRLLAVGGIDWLSTSGCDGMVAVWDRAERGRAAVFKGGVVGLAFHPAGRWLAAASLARSVRVFDVRGERLAAELMGHEDMVSCVAYSPDGNWLASGGADRTVRLWDADTGRPLARAELDTQVKALAFSPDGRHLFTGNANTSCYQLDVQRLLDAGC